MFYNDNAKTKKGNQDTNWKYIGVRLLPNIAAMLPGGQHLSTGVKIAERHWFEPSQPVGDRGWSNREVFERGLNALEGLISDYEKAVAKLESAKDKTGAGAPMVKWGQKEVVYLGRGLTTAIRKLYAGGFVRFVSNRVIH